MNKTLILVVEDDTPVHNLITTTLKTHDYKYISAKNGAGAIMEASTHNPDIVLLDLGLPDIDGVEVIEKIRSWSNMPIIVISAKHDKSGCTCQMIDFGNRSCCQSRTNWRQIETNRFSLIWQSPNRYISIACSYFCNLSAWKFFKHVFIYYF